MGLTGEAARYCFIVYLPQSGPVFAEERLLYVINVIKRTQISPAVKEQSLSLSAQVYLKQIVKLIEATATVKIMSLIDRSGSGLTC